MPARSDTVALVGIATAVAVADQLTKFSLVSTIGPGRLESRVEVVDGWLALEYTENRGAAFGLLSGLVPALAAASIAIVAGLLFLRAASTAAALAHAGYRSNRWRRTGQPRRPGQTRIRH